jgi:DNA-binding LacI/PurR family transcriptional regulator
MKDLVTAGINKSGNIAEQITAVLFEYISELPPNARIPNEVELSRHFGVCRMTVNKAINSLVDDGLLYRVRSKGTFVKERGFLPRSIKVLFPGPNSLAPNNRNTFFFRDIFSGLNERAHELNIRLEAIICTHDHRKESLKPELFETLMPDSALLVPGIWWGPVLKTIAEKTSNVVIMHNQADMSPHHDTIKNWYQYILDYQGAADFATEYFIRRGRDRIFTFCDTSEVNFPGPRWQGYCDALTRNNIAIDSELFLELPMNYEHELDMPVVTAAIRRALLTKKANAVLSPNSWFIKPVIRVAHELGLRIPEDVSIISIGATPESLEAPVTVSVMAVDGVQVGRDMTDIFARGKIVPGCTSKQFHLIERSSTC